MSMCALEPTQQVDECDWGSDLDIIFDVDVDDLISFFIHWLKVVVLNKLTKLNDKFLNSVDLSMCLLEHKHMNLIYSKDFNLLLFFLSTLFECNTHLW